MKKLSLAEIKELDSGDIISSFEGEVKKVYAQKSDDGDYGRWYLQNILITDGDEEIQITWSGEEPFSNNEVGKRYLFESTLTEKHGKQGLKWEVRESKGKTYSSVKVTPTAKITLLDGHEKGDSSAVDGPSAAAKPKPVSTQRPENKTPPLASTPVKAAKQNAAQSASAYALCLEAGRALKFAYEIEAGENSMSEESFRCMVSSFFIRMDRSGCIDKLPLHSIDPPKREEPTFYGPHEPEVPF